MLDENSCERAVFECSHGHRPFLHDLPFMTIEAYEAVLRDHVKRQHSTSWQPAIVDAEPEHDEDPDDDVAVPSPQSDHSSSDEDEEAAPESPPPLVPISPKPVVSDPVLQQYSYQPAFSYDEWPMGGFDSAQSGNAVSLLAKAAGEAVASIQHEPRQMADVSAAIDQDRENLEFESFVKLKDLTPRELLGRMPAWLSAKVATHCGVANVAILGKQNCSACKVQKATQTFVKCLDKATVVATAPICSSKVCLEQLSTAGDVPQDRVTSLRTNLWICAVCGIPTTRGTVTIKTKQPKFSCRSCERGHTSIHSVKFYLGPPSAQKSDGRHPVTDLTAEAAMPDLLTAWQQDQHMPKIRERFDAVNRVFVAAEAARKQRQKRPSSATAHPPKRMKN